MESLPLDCLSNFPSDFFESTCGDGYVDSGEECDCGSSDCSTLDPCCEGSTCQLKSGAECSETDPCCNSCSIRSASENYVCREAYDSECDVAETCDGIGSGCPSDIFAVAPGTSCTSSSGHAGECYQGGCLSYHLQCDGMFVPTDGACGSNACSNLHCSYSGTCYTFETEIADGTPCASGKQCFDGSCQDSSVLDYFFETKCSLSCDNEEVVAENICRSWDGSEVDISNCASAYPIEVGECSSFSPLVCSVELTLSTASPLSSGDFVDINWTTKGTVEFVSVVLEFEDYSWGTYILVESELDYYRYEIDDTVSDGLNSVKVVASSTSSNVSATFDVENTCALGVDCSSTGGYCAFGVCLCNDTYTGLDCSTTECDDVGVTCENGATCNNDGFLCECATGYEGTLCQVDNSTCSLSCNATNTEPDSSCSECACLGGFSGETCETCDLDCNYGTVDSRCLVCSCTEFYTGLNCNNSYIELSFIFSDLTDSNFVTDNDLDLFIDLIVNEISNYLGIASERVVGLSSTFSKVGSTYLLDFRIIGEDSSFTEISTLASNLKTEFDSESSVFARMEALRYGTSLTTTGPDEDSDNNSTLKAFINWVEDHLAVVIPGVVVVGFLLAYKLFFEKEEEGQLVIAGVQETSKPLLSPKRKESKAERIKRRKQEFNDKKQGKRKDKHNDHSNIADEMDFLAATFGVVRHIPLSPQGYGKLPSYNRSMDDLPPNWTVQYFDNGEAFYFNSASNTTQLERPVQ